MNIYIEKGLSERAINNYQGIREDKRKYEHLAWIYRTLGEEYTKNYEYSRAMECFEKEYAAFLGAKHCIGVGNGLDALWISFRILNIGQGDEVIVCSNAYIACVMGITINGNYSVEDSVNFTIYVPRTDEHFAGI